MPAMMVRIGGKRHQRSESLAALQLVLLSLPGVPLLSGVSPCPTLEAPSGVSPCPTPALEAPSGVSPCPTLEAPGGVSPGPTLSPCPRAGSARQRATQAVSPGATVLAMVDASRWPV